MTNLCKKEWKLSNSVNLEVRAKLNECTHDFSGKFKWSEHSQHVRVVREKKIMYCSKPCNKKNELTYPCWKLWYIIMVTRVHYCLYRYLKWKKCNKAFAACMTFLWKPKSKVHGSISSFGSWSWCDWNYCSLFSREVPCALDVSEGVTRQMRRRM